MLLPALACGLDQLPELALVRQVHDRGRAAALVAERGHRDPPAVVQAADHVEQRRADAVEEVLAELGRPRHLPDRLVGDGRVLEVDQHERDARVLLGGRVGAAEDEHLVGPRGARRPELLPGDDDLVTVDLALGLQPGQVRAGAGLGEALAVHVLAGDDPRQEVRLLLRRAVHDDRRADQALAHAADDPRHAGPVQLLVEDRDADGVQARRRRTPRGHCGQISLASASSRSHCAYSGALHRAGPPLAAVAAGGDDVVPVGELGQPGRGVPGDPVPRLGAELRDLRA